MFKFDESKEEDILDPVLTDKLKDWKGFDAPEGKLKMGIGQSFDTILGVAQKVGGLDMEFFRRITSNTNENGRNKIRNGKIAGYNWTIVSVSEMVNFFGIMLKISINELNLGGYNAYW